MHLQILEHESDGRSNPGDGSPGFTIDLAPTDAASPQAVAAWALKRFGTRLIVTTGFGMEGCVLIDMLSRLQRETVVHYLDTSFFFPETHALRQRLVERYPGLRLINAGTDLSPEEQERTEGPELWNRNPDRCCYLRKVVPMRRLLSEADAWMTGLRSSQSVTRASTRCIEHDPLFNVVKINPLAMWTREQVWDYVTTHDVPVNSLHHAGFPTIGCTHCTRPVAGSSPRDYSREGRWAGTGKTECGLHARKGSGDAPPRPDGEEAKT